jgi:hypothetical protein
MKIPKWSRIPTPVEIQSFDGLHCARAYAEARRTGWQCPSCCRTAAELIRWSEIRGPTMRRLYADRWGMGFTISLVRHHCHSGGPHAPYVNRAERFPPTQICGDCNSADGAAKRRLALPATWSFSPAEIAQFVTVTPHSGRTVIDYDVAHAIYRSAP